MSNMNLQKLIYHSRISSLHQNRRCCSATLPMFASILITFLFISTYPKPVAAIPTNRFTKSYIISWTVTIKMTCKNRGFIPMKNPRAPFSPCIISFAKSLVRFGPSCALTRLSSMSPGWLLIHDSIAAAIADTRGTAILTFAVSEYPKSRHIL